MSADKATSRAFPGDLTPASWQPQFGEVATGRKDGPALQRPLIAAAGRRWRPSSSRGEAAPSGEAHGGPGDPQAPQQEPGLQSPRRILIGRYA